MKSGEMCVRGMREEVHQNVVHQEMRGNTGVLHPHQEVVTDPEKDIAVVETPTLKGQVIVAVAWLEEAVVHHQPVGGRAKPAAGGPLALIIVRNGTEYPWETEAVVVEAHRIWEAWETCYEADPTLITWFI